MTDDDDDKETAVADANLKDLEDDGWNDWSNAMVEWLRSLGTIDSVDNNRGTDMMEAKQFERFTDRSRKVMQLAQQEAQRFNHEAVDTPHVLIGLLEEGSGIAANVLKNLDVDLRRIRVETEALLPGPGVTCDPELFVGKLPYTDRVKRMFDRARTEAESLNHNYVGTEHLLLGMLKGFTEWTEDDKHLVDPAARVLVRLGVHFADVRNEVMNLLGYNIGKDEPEKGEAGEEDVWHDGTGKTRAFTVTAGLPEQGTPYCSMMAAANGRTYSDAAYCGLVKAAVHLACPIQGEVDPGFAPVAAAARRFLIGEFGGEK